MAKNKPKQHASNQHNPLVVLLLGVVLLGVSYGATSFAIDSGRISIYIITFVSLYFGVRYCIGAAKIIIRK